MSPSFSLPPHLREFSLALPASQVKASPYVAMKDIPHPHSCDTIFIPFY